MGAAAPTQQWPLAGPQAKPAPTVKQPDAASKASVKLLAPAPPPGTELPQTGAAACSSARPGVAGDWAAVGVGGKGGGVELACRCCCAKRLPHAQCGISAPTVGWRLRVPPLAVAAILGASRRRQQQQERGGGRRQATHGAPPPRHLAFLRVPCLLLWAGAPFPSAHTSLRGAPPPQTRRRACTAARRPAGAPPPGGAVHSLPLGPRNPHRFI